MKIDDESLSAFLDNELSAEEMDEVREAINRNPALGERIAALRRVDELVKQQAASLDDVPLPEKVLQGLQQHAASDSDAVLPQAWRLRLAFFRPVPALAAGILLVLGFTAGYLSNSGVRNAIPALADYAGTLDTAVSGEAITLEDGGSFLNRFSFRDIGGRYCRQYRLDSEGGASENVACHDGEDWQLVAGLQLPSGSGAPEYRPAAGPALPDAILDGLMEGEALSLDEEIMLIETQWR